MRLVVVESPFAGITNALIERNIRYARSALRDCLMRGEAPIASHLLYTQPGILDDNVPIERALGIEAGLIWAKHAEASCFYIDLGWSKGMREAFARASIEGRTIESRTIPNWESP